MPLMPIPPIPTKWTRCFFSNIPIARSVSSARERVTLFHDPLGRVGAAQALRRLAHRGEPRAVLIQRAHAGGELLTVELAVENHFGGTLFHELFGVQPLVVVHRVRIRIRIAGLPNTVSSATVAAPE